MSRLLVHPREAPKLDVQGGFLPSLMNQRARDIYRMMTGQPFMNVDIPSFPVLGEASAAKTAAHIRAVLAASMPLTPEPLLKPAHVDEIQIMVRTFSYNKPCILAVPPWLNAPWRACLLIRAHAQSTLPGCASHRCRPSKSTCTCMISHCGNTLPHAGGACAAGFRVLKERDGHTRAAMRSLGRNCQCTGGTPGRDLGQNI